MKMSADSSDQQLLKFFLLTFLFSWILWLPGLLVTLDLLSLSQTFTDINNVIKWIAGMGPSLVAIYLIIKLDGKIGVKRLFKRLLQVKLGYWYIPVFLFIPLVLVIAHILNFVLFNASFPQTGLLAEPWWISLVFAIFFLMQFSEELGWRGFALDRLQIKYNALFSSIILGILWAVWHIPMFLISGFGQYDNHLPFEQFFLTIILVSVLITWMQNNTRGSLIPAFIAHAMINLSGEVLPLIEKNNETQGDYTVWIITNILLFLSVITIVSFWGYINLVRQNAPVNNTWR